MCIVQDAPNTNEQLQIMDLIYSRARCTIIAMAGQDANFGLPGIISGTRVKQPAAVLGKFTFLAELQPLEHLLMASRYSTRAWTYQEMMLSPRCIFVSPYQIYFRCNQEGCSEDSNGGISSDLNRYWLDTTSSLLRG